MENKTEKSDSPEIPNHFIRLLLIFLELISTYILSLKSELLYSGRYISPRNVIITAFSNEGPYLKEWIDYHRNLGFTHFYLADNNFDDSDEPYLKEIRKLPYVKILDFKKRGYDQVGYVSQMYDKSPDAVNDWFLAIDVDEYFTLNRNITLEEYKNLVMEHGCASIKINWLVYGNNGHLKKENGTVIERFPLHTNIDYLETKSFSKGGIKAGIYVHNFIPKRSLKCCNSLFQKCKCQKSEMPKFTYEYAYIRHYFTKSEEEWAYKQKKWQYSNNPRYRWDKYNKINCIPPNVPHVEKN